MVTPTTYSMTAFASQMKHIPNQGIITCEIRAVNHRYLDIQFRTNGNIAHLEPLLRNRLRDQLKRGRIEIRLSYKTITQSTAFDLNKPLITQLLTYCDHIQTLNSSCALPNTLELLKWPDVLQPQESNPEETLINTTCITLFDEALAQLIKAKATEGDKIREIILERLNQLEMYRTSIIDTLPQLKDKMHQRLMNRFREAKLEAEPQRFEQELVFMLQKADISEELDRLKIHLTQCYHDLNQAPVRGPRLDFLMQELNREVNTIASKSNHAQLTLKVVDMKVLIEEMREQIQNIE